jgi:hypothetical protein
MAEQNLTAIGSDPVLLLDRARAIVDVLRYNAEAQAFCREHSRAIYTGKTRVDVVPRMIMPDELDDGAIATALHVAWDCITTVRDGIEADKPGAEAAS